MWNNAMGFNGNGGFPPIPGPPANPAQQVAVLGLDDPLVQQEFVLSSIPVSFFIYAPTYHCLILTLKGADVNVGRLGCGSGPNDDPTLLHANDDHARSKLATSPIWLGQATTATAAIGSATCPT